ncbi:arabinan endo-1,5-alpha-L-arabinosidase [Isoptericola sp. NPDC019693]|uniref:arabinan endo-1,5-alpha-L-arabinosidase n=1 Tax=Isoptericola sp. NPDC019693 TaxID=3364009 RepID=UPI00378D6FBB
MRRTPRRAAATLAGAVSVVLLAACGADPVAGTVVPVEGDVEVHDPSLVVDGEDWWVFSTGNLTKGLGAIQVRHSVDGNAWTYEGEVLPDDRPAWQQEAVPGVTNLWAPEVVEHDGTWYLYYAASTFGSNTSAIGLMTSDELGADVAWQDRGIVWQSSAGDGYNAIDPAVVTDEDGTPWMAFGSFWGGIQLVELSWPSGMPVEGGEPQVIASRGDATNAIEAPALLHHGGYWYLFVSKDSCCQGTDSTYHVEVGRAEDITGPYVDAEGDSLLEDGGTPVLDAVGDMIGPGGESVAVGGGDELLGFHFYDGADGGTPTLAIRSLAWTDAGWPVAMTVDEQESLTSRPGA